MCVWGGIMQSVEGLNRTKRQKKFELALPDCLSCNINPLLPFMLPVLRSSDLEWNIHHWLPISQAFEMQHQLSWVSGLHMADWSFSASVIT